MNGFSWAILLLSIGVLVMSGGKNSMMRGDRRLFKLLAFCGFAYVLYSLIISR